MWMSVLRPFLSGHSPVCWVMGALFISTLASGQAPTITEFLADNESALPLEAGELLDEEGDASDWIELFNPTRGTIDITGWYLTDNANDLTQWSFPQRSLASGQFVVVFASGKDRRDPTRPPKPLADTRRRHHRPPSTLDTLCQRRRHPITGSYQFQTERRRRGPGTRRH